MPWKEPGKGDKDPWKSGEQQPPDLEEIFSNVTVLGKRGGFRVYLARKEK